ncbi:hypothetical protein LG288_11575 [Idiomarina seosinensis]|uniref:hypothetical protein n=1 Tax=Idiomarina seosinensis TaxID=281739 RepID=UPI00384BDB73
MKNMSKGTELSKGLYGGILDIDNAGFSAGVELLNFIYGVPEDKMLSPSTAPAPIKHGHHQARQLAYGLDGIKDRTGQIQNLRNMLQGESAEVVLGKLFASLQIQPPNVKRTTDSGWTRKPFFPFTSSLIHWDIKKSNENVERVWMRGGGALLHKILRDDPNSSRLENIRTGFKNLYTVAGGSALDRLSKFFRSESPRVEADKPDEIESSSRANIDNFEDVYRDGLLNILEHKKLTTVGKVEALVNWSAIWLSIMQYRRSCSEVENKLLSPIVCDCATSATSIRRLARRQFQNAFSIIQKAIDTHNKDKFSEIKAGQKNRIRGFFPSTASAVGLLNAYTGNRYFTLKVNALETIVAALVPATEEMPFAEFVDQILYLNLGIVVSRGAAKSAGLLDDYDGTIFEENEKGLATQMKAAGLLTTYSDATQMISFRR